MENKNNSAYYIGGVLAVAVIILYILHFTSGSGKNSSNGKIFDSMNNDSSLTLPIAYVNIDSLLINYNFAKDLNEALMRKEENSRASLVQKERQFETAAREFQRKVQNNAFLSQERAEQEQQRILKMQQEYQEMAERLSHEFAMEQEKLNFEMEDTIKVQIKEFNKSHNYQLIISNRGTSNILMANKKYDITKDVTNYLNKKYGPVTQAATDNKTVGAETE